MRTCTINKVFYLYKLRWIEIRKRVWYTWPRRRSTFLVDWFSGAATKSLDPLRLRWDSSLLPFYPTLVKFRWRNNLFACANIPDLQVICANCSRGWLIFDTFALMHLCIILDFLYSSRYSHCSNSAKRNKLYLYS